MKGEGSECLRQWSEMLSRRLGKAIFQNMPTHFMDIHERGFQSRMESWHFGMLDICQLMAGRHRMSVKAMGDKRPRHRYILMLQRSGISIIQQQGRTVFLNRDQCVVLDLQLGFRISGNRIVDLVFISHDGISNLCQKSLITDIPVVVLEHTCIFSKFRNFIFEIVSGEADYGDNAADSVASMAHCLFHHALEFQFPCISEQHSQGPIDRPRILRYIESHLGDPLLSADKVALKFGCSVRTIYRKFKNDWKEGVEEYIWRRRLERAALTLRSNPKESMNISHIARECGFSNMSHFYSAFKKQFNTTPGRYRG
jgi:AraC-like DNA-binding protein